MRVTSNLMFRTGVDAMQSKQQELLRVQEQSLSGLKTNRPSDDPAGTFRHMLFSSDLSGVQSLKRTSEFASQRLALADGHINGVHERMIQAQELVMKLANSDVGGNPNILKSAASEAEAIYESILKSINSEMDEVPLFGGGRTRSPFNSEHLDTTNVKVRKNGTGALFDTKSGPAATDVKVQAGGVGDLVNAETGFYVESADGSPTSNLPMQAKATFVSESEGYTVVLEGASEQINLNNLQPTGVPKALDLGDGISFVVDGTPSPGDVFSFNVAASEPPVAEVVDSSKISDPPLNYKISFLSASGEYQVDLNGVETAPAFPDNEGNLDLGNGVRFTPGNTVKAGDVFYFDVVPSYRGGVEDRPVQVLNGHTLPGNVTGKELLEGGGDMGRGINILGALASLRGALLRADTTEVGAQLNRIQEGRAQVSDLQAVTGIRNTLVDAVHATLELDEVSLQEAKASNVEADLFEVLSRLEQTSQSMQVMTVTEREVLNTSLIDFIR